MTILKFSKNRTPGNFVGMIFFPLFALLLSQESFSQTFTICNDSVQWIPTSHGCMHIQTFKSGENVKNPALVIVIHGDAPFSRPGYQYRLAKLIAQQNNNTVAIGILRPGYTDDEGKTSAGKKGFTTADNYTKEVIEALSELISTLKRIYGPSEIIIAGHSGGAAISADIISLYPRLADAAVLVSGPYNVGAFREYMSKRQPTVSAWKTAVQSISPDTIINKISKNTSVVLLHGEQDDVVPIDIASNYYHQLKLKGIKATLIAVPGKGHEIFLEPAVLEAIKSLITK